MEIEEKLKLIMIGVVKTRGFYDCGFTRAIFAYNGISYICGNPESPRYKLGCYPPAPECEIGREYIKGTPQVEFVG
jgi:hypothetical protein